MKLRFILLSLLGIAISQPISATDYNLGSIGEITVQSDGTGIFEHDKVKLISRNDKVIINYGAGTYTDEVNNRIFVGSHLDINQDLPSVLEIYNNTGHPVTIKANISCGNNRNGQNALFYVWQYGTLKIHGTENSPIIIDANGSSIPTRFGLIETTGTIDMEYVTIQNVTFENYGYTYGGKEYNNPKDGDCAVFKLSPWTTTLAGGGGDQVDYNIGTLTLKHCRITNINNMNGGYASVLTTFGDPTRDTTKGNTTKSNKITFEDVEIDHVQQNGHIKKYRYYNENLIIDKDENSAGILRFRGAWLGDFEMVNCKIHDNTSTYACAGLLWNAIGDGHQNIPTLTIRGCKFYNNHSDNDCGALQLEGRFTFDYGPNGEYNEIYNNTAQRGAGIRIWGYSGGDPVTAQEIKQHIGESVKIYNNTATLQGGGLMINYSNDYCTLPRGMDISTTIDGAQFTNNKAGWQGGGICLNHNYNNVIPKLYLDKGTFDGNRVEKNTDDPAVGGGLHTWNFDINRHDYSTDWCRFTNNYAEHGGGGIYIEGSSKVTLNKLEISGCTVGKDDLNETANAKGGAIYISGNASQLTLKEVRITNNSSLNEGGGIYANSPISISFEKGEISGNRTRRTDNATQGAGGGIYMTGTKMTIGEGKILNNTSTSFYGGGVYMTNSTLTINNGEISNNRAKWRGGGLYVDYSTFTMNNGKINDNTAENEFGGGLSIVGSNFTMKGGEINGNKAAHYGGGIFFDNQVTEAGGNSPKTFYFENGSISNNVSGSHGGGICIYGGNGGTDAQPQTVYLKKGTISGNTAADGGGIYMNGWNKCILNMENTTVENNTAYVGAGMLFHYSILKYNNGLIRYNRAISRAGKSAPSTMARTRHDDSSKVGPSGSAYLQNDQPNENINGIAGGLFLGDHARSTFSGNSFGIYGNYAEYGGDDIVSIGAADNGTVQVTLPDVSSMTLNDFKVGVPQAALFWAQDYINGDTGYTQYKPSNATATSTVERYRTLLAKRTENIASIPSGVAYGNNQYVSVALGYKYVYVDIKKSGLKEGESAIFNIYSTKDVTASSTPYMQIVLTGNAAGSEVSRKIALTPGDWTVMETGWSWTYTGKSASNETVLGNPAIKRKIHDNPSDAERIFSFTNTKNTSVPNAEKVKVNDNMKK